MKWIVALGLIGGLAWLIATVPPKKAAKMAAKGLRAGWEWVESATRREPPARPPPKVSSAKVQAATPQRKPGRDGIVPQPPKEKLEPRDREALDELLAQPARAGTGR